MTYRPKDADPTRTSYDPSDVVDDDSLNSVDSFPEEDAREDRKMKTIHNNPY